MARDHSPAARSAPRRQARPYSPPTPLEDIHILDLLELAGSQEKAAVTLNIHQSTVCRSAALMGEQFRLQPRPGASVLRYGTNESQQLLRLSYRAHRMMDGQLRIATDPLHQPLLAGMLSVQAVPPKFRHSGEWAQLLSQALIDGAPSCSANPIVLGPSPSGVGIPAADLAGADDGAAGGTAAAAVHRRNQFGGRPPAPQGAVAVPLGHATAA